MPDQNLFLLNLNFWKLLKFYDGISRSLEQTNIDLTRVYLARSQPLRETSLCLMARLVTDLTPSILNNPQIKNYFPKVYCIYLVTISWIWSFCESVSCFGFKPSDPTHKIRATWLRCADEFFSMTTLLPQYFNKLEWDWNSKVEIYVYILIWISKLFLNFKQALTKHYLETPRQVFCQGDKRHYHQRLIQYTDE